MKTEYIKLIEKSQLLCGINASEVHSLLNCLNAKIIEFDKNEIVVHEGNLLSKFGLVVEGELQLVQYDYFGNKNILSTIGPLQIFGEAFSYSGLKMPFTVECSLKTVVILFNSDKISTPCENCCIFHRRLINNLLKIISEKNILLTQKIECISKRTTREKILAYLSIEAVKKENNEFSINLDRQRLADYLGVERSAMSAEISKLRKENIIECKKNIFKLL